MNTFVDWFTLISLSQYHMNLQIEKIYTKVQRTKWELTFPDAHNAAVQIIAQHCQDYPPARWNSLSLQNASESGDREYWMFWKNYPQSGVIDPGVLVLMKTCGEMRLRVSA